MAAQRWRGMACHDIIETALRPPSRGAEEEASDAYYRRAAAPMNLRASERHILSWHQHQRGDDDYKLANARRLRYGDIAGFIDGRAILAASLR